MSREKGKKKLKNQPIYWEDVKKNHTVTLTDLAWGKLKQMASKEGLSVSEFIEQWVRSQT